MTYDRVQGVWDKAVTSDTMASFLHWAATEAMGEQ